MAERTDQLTRTRDSQVDDPSEHDAAGSSSERTFDVDERTTGGIRDRLTTLFSPTYFLLALVLSIVGLVVGSGTVPFAGGLVGVLLAGFAVGLISSHRPAAETAAAGAAVVGASTFLDYIVWTFVGIGLPIVAIGAVLGLGVGGLGGYLGSDLRDGLTRDL